MGRGGAQTGVEQVVRHLQAPALLLDREQRVHLANDAATRLDRKSVV